MKLLFYCSYSRNACEHKHSANMVRLFPMSTNANKQVFLVLSFDRTARDNVEQGGVGSVRLFRRFSRMKLMFSKCCKAHYMYVLTSSSCEVYIEEPHKPALPA